MKVSELQTEESARSASRGHAFAGPLRRNAANPRYFTDDTGRAVYLTGSHTWAVMQDMWLESQPRRNMDYAGFLDLLEECGHTFLRFWQWMHPRNARWSSETTLFDPQPYARTGPGLANDGLPKFDLTVWNDAYFARLRERVAAAGRRGIYVGVMLFEAWTIKGTTAEQDPWPYHPLHPDNNVNGVTDDPRIESGPGQGRAWNLFSLRCPQLLAWQQRYAQQVVGTLNDFDHVLYEICNEVPNRPEAMAWQDHLCAFIHEYERGKPKQHPVGITAEGGNQDNARLFATGADWISPGNGRLFEYRYNPPAADGTKVILTDTDHLWGHGADVGWIWKSFCRGMNVLFMDPWEPIPAGMPGWVQGGVSLNQRYYHLWDPVRRNLGYARRFADRMDLNRCVPHGERCTSTYCLVSPGQEYLCFFASGGHEGLDLWQAPGTYAVEWFDPATGRTHTGACIEGARRHALAAPFAGPAVLYVRRV
ncbi:MAG: hypothetical protein HY332_18735 [Chloroflexi bacterium]|nr:hypothetical protein [Chloroflexota bacterium]